MLTNSFVHIPGVGAVTEKRLWTAGLLDWHQMDSAGARNPGHAVQTGPVDHREDLAKISMVRRSNL